MERERYLIRTYAEKKEKKRENARESFKEAVLKILDFEDAGVITTSEAISMIAKYGNEYEKVNEEYTATLKSFNRFRKSLV